MQWTSDEISLGLIGKDCIFFFLKKEWQKKVYFKRPLMIQKIQELAGMSWSPICG